MTLTQLAERLGSFAPRTHLNGPEADLLSVQSLFSVEALQPDVLYLAASPAEARLFPGAGLQLLVCGVPEGMLPESAANLLLVSAPRETVLPAVQEAFRDERRELAFSRRLVELLASEVGLQRLVEESAVWMENPIYVIDAGYSVAAANWDLGPGDESTRRLRAERYLQPSDLNAIHRDGIHARVMASPRPLLIRNPSYPGERIAARLLVRGKTAGHMIVTEALRPFRPGDLRVAALLQDALVQVLQRDAFVRDALGLPYEYLMADLLDGRLGGGRQLRERLAGAELPAFDRLWVTAAELSRSPRLLRPAAVRERMERCLPGSRSLLYHGTLVLLTLRRAADPLRPEEAEAFRALCREEALVCGRSVSFTDLASLPDYYRQALLALDCAGADAAPGLYAYEDLAAAHVLRVFCRSESPALFEHPAARLLRDYDETHGTALADTLLQYLRYERNVLRTAREMHLHRNTLNHRLDRIRALTGPVPEDPEQRLYLLLSLHGQG